MSRGDRPRVNFPQQECHLEKWQAFLLQIPLSDKIRYAATNEETML